MKQKGLPLELTCGFLLRPCPSSPAQPGWPRCYAEGLCGLDTPVDAGWGAGG